MNTNAPHRVSPSPLGRLPILALTALTAAFFASACCACFEGKPVPADKKAMVGKWEGDGMTLRITADGHVNYKRVKGATTEVNGPVQRWGEKEFEVGLGPVTTTFAIDKPPRKTKKDGKWWMTVDGVELIRVFPPDG